MELVEAGVITNRKKNLHPGKSILTFAMGTRRLYDYLDDNPPWGYTPWIMSTIRSSSRRTTIWYPSTLLAQT